MTLTREFGTSNIHNHTVFSDGRGTVQDYVLFAREKKISRFGVSDHALHGLLPGSCITTPGVLSEYLEELSRAEKSGKKGLSIRIFKGLEVPLESIENLFGKLGDGVFHLEYMLVESYDVWNPRAIGILDGFKEKFGLKVVSIAHPIFSGSVDEIVTVLAKCGICVELNSGHRTFAIPGQGIYFKRIIREGIPMTFGSDSHSFERLDDLDASLDFYSKSCKAAAVDADADAVEAAAGGAVTRSNTS